ncbi:MAG TPA: SIS domain-containing protein [Candidatus Saccharimonadales bacterium]|jgi:D-sedoheptulose 7-phosphate isomerase|nr:SIS domain-containing protein [Candidatus Saccharimonadales bacterium]
MKVKKYIEDSFLENIKVEQSTLKVCWPKIIEASHAVIDCYYKRGGSVFTFGNGGSATDAEHVAEELLNRFKNYRIPISAYALTSQPAILTGIANDFGFEKIFSRQLEALATPKDLIMAFSTSGNSKNVINGVSLVKSRGIKTIGLTGKNGGELAKLVDIAIKVPSDDVARVQEVHTIIGHIICGIVDETLFGETGLEW